MAGGAVVWLAVWTYGTLVLPQVLPRGAGAAQLHCLLLALVPLFVAPVFIGRDADDSGSRGESPLLGVVAMAGCYYAFRVGQLVLEGRFKGESVGHCMMHVGFTFHDIQSCTRGIPVEARVAVAKQNVTKVFSFGCLLYLLRQGFAAMRLLPKGPAVVAMATVSGGLYAWFSLEVFGGFLAALYAPFGLELPALVNQPLSARGLRDFWRNRWNSVIQQILASYVFAFFFHRALVGHTLSVFLTFLASGLLHVWPALFYSVVSARDVFCILAYFLVQCALIFIEESLTIAKWQSNVARKLWLISSVFLSLPLIASPVFTHLGMPEFAAFRA